MVDGQEAPIGDDHARAIQEALQAQGMLELDGRIGHAFDPRAKDFSLDLPDELRDLVPAVTDLLASYRFERYVRKERDEGPSRLKRRSF